MKKVIPGIDLPGWFYYEALGIEKNVNFIFHEFRTLYEDTMNSYTGSLENPRFNIQSILGKEIWGYPLTDNKNNPIPENKWHIWIKVPIHGIYYHVAKIESIENGYLNVLLSRLHLQANMTARKYQRMMASEAEVERLKEQKRTEGLMSDVQKENSGFLNKVKDNAARGLWKPTNPTKDAIYSFSGQKNRSRIVRPLDDHEGGLILPENWPSKKNN